jgi:hypothetical protein
MRSTQQRALGILTLTSLMFSWLRRRKERSNTVAFVKSVPDILARYGELIEKYPTGFIDETWLPENKSTMKRALKVGWILATDDDDREWISAGWNCLSVFQPGVGDVPIGTSESDENSYEGTARLNRWLRFAKMGQAEDELNEAEMNEFIRQYDQT